MLSIDVHMQILSCYAMLRYSYKNAIQFLFVKKCTKRYKKDPESDETYLAAHAIEKHLLCQLDRHGKFPIEPFFPSITNRPHTSGEMKSGAGPSGRNMFLRDRCAYVMAIPLIYTQPFPPLPCYDEKICNIHLNNPL